MHGSLLRLMLWLMATLTVGWAGDLALAQDHGKTAYRFRQSPVRTALLPAHDLLDDRERAFLEQLPEIRVGLNLPDNRPYEVIGPDGEVSGIQVEILTHLALSLGLKVRPVVLPSFPQALEALRERRVDLMATLAFEPAREPYVAYTLGTAPNPGAIIGRAGDPRFADNPTLNGLRVAIERRYVAQHFVRRTWPEALVVDQEHTGAALASVAVGADDFYVGSLLMAMDRIQRDGVKGLEVKKTLAYNTGLMHFGVRKDWPLLASALSKGIAAMRSAPLPALEAALQSARAPGAGALPVPMPLSPVEQAQLSGRTVLRIGAVRGLTLLNEVTPEGAHAGIASDYTAHIVASLGVAADIVPFDSVAQMLDALREGRIHLVPLLTRTPAREREFVYSAPYLEMPYFIVARTDAPLYWGLDSLRGKRLALTAQHPLREAVAQHYPDIRVLDAPPGFGAMDMVARGDADAAVEVKLYANLRIQRDDAGRLRTVTPVEELPAQFHFAASREAAGLVPLIDRALAQVPPAERDRMMRRWVALDFQPVFPWRRHLPWIAAAALGLLALAGASLWWNRRLAREIKSRRLAEERLADITASLPGVVFQYINGPDGQLEAKYESPTVDAFIGPGTSQQPSTFEVVASRMRPEEAAEVRAARDVALTGQPFKVTARYNDPRHGERWLHCEAAVRQLPQGRVCWTGYIVDVSPERALQAQLLDAVQAKNLFVASASHELRGPLQVIMLALQRLAAGPLDEAQRQMCRIATDSTASLGQLVNDVLDLARIEAGRMDLHPAPLDLPGLLAQVVENHRLAAEAGGLRLGLDVDESLPRRVLADGLRLRQLLVNLIGNAIKYTPEGEIQVSAHRVGSTTGQAGDDRLALVVRDTGIGIPLQRQHAVFEPFGTLHLPTEKPEGVAAQDSTGLGLAICKRLVDAMGGRIVLDSQPGRGTQVAVELPMPAEAAAPGPSGQAQAPGPSALDTARGPPLLLVDDDGVSRLLMSETLRRQGWCVSEAGTLAEARRACRQAGPQGFVAVISDHQLPDGEGLAFLQELAVTAAGRSPPRLVLCSGSPLATGADTSALAAVLRKPVGADRLTAALNGWLVAHTSGSEPAASRT